MNLFLLNASMLFLFFLLVNMKHFLTTLLSIEMMMLLFIFIALLNLSPMNLFLFLIFIVMSACEGALGLSILVNLSRSYGSDFLYSFNLLK